VIADARYDDPGLARLRSPGQDAEALAGVLGDAGVGGFRVESLIDVDERTIRRRIAAFFADHDRDDLLLLHFSCHGIKDARGRLHLAARDTDLSVLGATSVPASFVHDALNETQSHRVVLMLDCCYSGAFARGAVVRSGNDVHIADEFGVGSGRVVLTASSATEYAFEGGELTQDQAQPSVFTSALVDGLRSGAADLDADGEIGIDELPWVEAATEFHAAVTEFLHRDEPAEDLTRPASATQDVDRRLEGRNTPSEERSVAN
jgi:uncharacterized caspase-like protein